MDVLAPAQLLADMSGRLKGLSIDRRFLAMVFAEHESTKAGEAFFEFCEKTIKVNWQN